MVVAAFSDFGDLEDVILAPKHSQAPITCLLISFITHLSSLMASCFQALFLSLHLANHRSLGRRMMLCPARACSPSPPSPGTGCWATAGPGTRGPAWTASTPPATASSSRRMRCSPSPPWVCLHGDNITTPGSNC